MLFILSSFFSLLSTCNQGLQNHWLAIMVLHKMPAEDSMNGGDQGYIERICITHLSKSVKDLGAAFR